MIHEPIGGQMPGRETVQHRETVLPPPSAGEHRETVLPPKRLLRPGSTGEVLTFCQAIETGLQRRHGKLMESRFQGRRGDPGRPLGSVPEFLLHQPDVGCCLLFFSREIVDRLIPR
jgi:hypothetical protein